MRGVADRDCATDSGKGGTGGGGGASALFDEVGPRAEPKVIDRDLRSDCDSLRMRDPEELLGGATGAARGGADGSVWGGGSVGFEVGDEGNGCSSGRCEGSCMDGVDGDTRSRVAGVGLPPLSSDPVSLSPVTDSYSTLDS